MAIAYAQFTISYGALLSDFFTDHMSTFNASTWLLTHRTVPTINGHRVEWLWIYATHRKIATQSRSEKSHKFYRFHVSSQWNKWRKWFLDWFTVKAHWYFVSSCRNLADFRESENRLLSFRVLCGRRVGVLLNTELTFRMSVKIFWDRHFFPPIVIVKCKSDINIVHNIHWT